MIHFTDDQRPLPTSVRGTSRAPRRSVRGASAPPRTTTRQRPQVDRIACPWLIKRFIDSDAEFLYVPGDQVQTVAERDGATPFDVPGAGLGHHGDECSFDAIVRTYTLTAQNPAIEHLARIVRGADTANHDLTPESRGLLAIAQGFSLAYVDDHAQLAAELPVYDALYAWCQRQVSRNGPAPVPEPSSAG